MPGSKHDKTFPGVFNTKSSTSELLNSLGHFAGMGRSGGSTPLSPNPESLVDPLVQPAVAGGNGPATQDLLDQLFVQTQVRNGVAGAGADGTDSNSFLGVLSRLLGGGSGGGSFGGLLGGILGSGFGLSPLISGLLDLFGGGGGNTPPPLVPFQMPPSIQFQGGIDGPGGAGISAADYGQNGLPRGVSQTSPQAAGQQITVQVNAMDSKSFLDHSDDIAQAVRQALLQSNSLNDVISGI